MKPQTESGAVLWTDSEAPAGRAFIGIGSNQGERRQNMRRAVGLLSQSGPLEILRVSSLYETDPVGLTDQPPFLNAVAEIRTVCDEHRLLEILQAIEREMGRERRIKWGPRVIDLDLLLLDARVVMDETLAVPHPELIRRKFVLLPLVEIGPDRVHPVTGRTMRQIWEEAPAEVKAQKAQRVEGPDWYA